ncbi:plasmid mobilization relaxosome protein MobC [Listeria seeligeri]|nr:plasmid mobilization relaxosome protein MobC [Listeria seeligeri]MBC1942093.1 plasmid mobilization relaxosome protein MobC [Listeria seeligeri]
MVNRTRNSRIHFDVTEEESKMIQIKMKQLNTKNRSAFLRKRAIDGYVIKIDYSNVKKCTIELNKVGVKINYIAKKINSSNQVFHEDIIELKKLLTDVLTLQKSILEK